MKTTVELLDALLRAVKRYAAARGMTMREVLETGLRYVGLRRASSKPFRLKRCTFRGKGLARKESWVDLRARIYEGRGA
jgi:hypothetical protein